MAGDKTGGHLLQGEDRKRYVRSMFGQIAPQYDLMNRLMSGWQDQKWRLALIHLIELPAGGRLLDLATGTGDVAKLVLAQDSSRQVIGADFSLRMMRMGQRSSLGSYIHWCGADALYLPFPNGAFDAVTSAYLLRNLPPESLADGLHEQARVVRSGGKIAALDATPPQAGLINPLVRFHLNVIIPALGRLIARQAEPFRYLAESSQGFHSPAELVESFRSVGLQQIKTHSFMFGTMTLVVGSKP
jgi:demethylmenaquinone methyltransferase/2-methoxy-6-polyprenyl-1,4-benzoquinol methylase